MAVSNRGVALLSTGLLALLIGASADAKEPARSGAQLEPAGTMEVRLSRGGGWTTISAAQALGTGATVRTQADGAVLRLGDGAVLVLGPSTTLQLQEATDVLLDAGAPTRVSRVDLKEGSVRVDVPAQVRRALMVVYSEQVLAAVRQGQARFKTMPRGGGMLTALEDGQARAATHGRWISLSSGQYMVLGGAGSAAQAQSLPAAVQFDQQFCQVSTHKSCAMAVVSGADKAPLTVRWTPVSGAGQFVVRLAKDPQMQSLVSTRTLPAVEHSFTSEPLGAGRYWVTVQTIGADGVEGRSTAARPLRVLGLSLDEGAFMAPNDPVVVLPAQARVRFSEPEDIQMASSQGTYMALAPSMRLGEEEQKRVVRLRIQDQPYDQVLLDLERRNLSAHIELGPKSARWPQDPVFLRIQLQDPSGRIPLAQFEPQIRVRVNQAEVSPKLQRQGNQWVGQLTPMAGQGPWVVRVEVADRSGGVIGRDFLEIVGKDLSASAKRRLVW